MTYPLPGPDQPPLPTPTPQRGHLPAGYFDAARLARLGVLARHDPMPVPPRPRPSPGAGG